MCAVYLWSALLEQPLQCMPLCSLMLLYPSWCEDMSEVRFIGRSDLLLDNLMELGGERIKFGPSLINKGRIGLFCGNVNKKELTKLVLGQTI